MKAYSLRDISEPLSDDLLPPYERPGYLPALTPNQKSWVDDGVLILKDFFPAKLMDDYEECWWRENGAKRMGGWPDCCPYMRHPELRELALCQSLADVLKELLGVNAGMHLNLTGFVSTERKFHQDSYLNPPFVGAWYIAAWIALDRIHPSSGPFQFVRGSHKWPVIRQKQLFERIGDMQKDPRWPTLTQDTIEELLLGELQERGAAIEEYLPGRGDLLLWHSSLVHRGSKPKTPGMLRRSLIAHYSAIDRRPDMPAPAVKASAGGWYFPIQTGNPV